MSEQKSLSPEEVLVGAFEFYQKSTLSLDVLTTIALAANCPSPEIAQAVLQNLVTMGVLERKNEDNQILFTLVDKSNQPKL